MRGQRVHNHRASGDDAYAAKPECISVLAPLLGLDSETSPQKTKAAVLDLLERANERVLPTDAQDAARLISLATTPELGDLDFLEVRLVSFNGDLHGVYEVKQAVIILLSALDSQTTSEVAQSVSSVSKGEMSDMVPPPPLISPGCKHVSELIPQALERRVDKRVEAFERALRYLQKNGIVAPTPDETTKPSPEVTLTLAKHYMVWKWNSKTQSWDPRLDTRRNQSLFTAAPKYLQTIAIKGDTERAAFIRSIRNARSVEDNPRYRADQSPANKLLINDLMACATKILDREVSLPTVMRLQALYRFLNPTPPQSTDSK